MSKYTFTFKKDDIFVEFTTTDKMVVENQFQIWVADADDYVNNRQRKSVKPENISRPQPKEEEKKIETPAQAIEEKPVHEISQNTEQPEVLDKASDLLRTINTIQGVNAEINAEANSEVKTEDSAETPEKEKPDEIQKFEDILEKTIENPTFEPVKTQDKVFLNLINSKNTTDKFHYLIITAYYLSEFEKLERFSLKQINAKLMQNLSEVIDHVTLQEAINQNLIELIPDLTGVSEIGEYKLTLAGEEFFANRI